MLTYNYSKPEDRAYSLMGILGVRMRADYGEGRARAISRLFEAIIRTTGDVSIFNWTGAYCGNQGVGRSMYPTDFDAYSDIEPESYLEKKDGRDKPAHTLSAVTLDHIGVHARFDICEIKNIVIEGNNTETFDALCDLEKSVSSNSVRSLSSNSSISSDFTCTCELTYVTGFRDNVTVLCSLRSLKAILEGLQTGVRSSSRWVTARFAGVQTSNWFLCEIQHTTETDSDGVFSDVIGTHGFGGAKYGTGRGDINARNFMLYLESSGFAAKRVATTRLYQENLRELPKDAVKNAFMWIG
jgi:hypothetical protein